MYFVNEGAKFIFALLHTDCEVRMNLLGITELHYTSDLLANAWRDYIKIAILRTDFDDDLKTQALEKLGNLYKNMIDS